MSGGGATHSSWLRLHWQSSLLLRATDNISMCWTAEWDLTTAHLYDPAERLYFRDKTFLDRKEANGAKLFWGRGNGWVLAGLARTLAVMPKDYRCLSRGM